MRSQINHRQIRTRWLIAAVVLLAFSATTNSSAATSSMTIEEFVKLPSFEGCITQLEEMNSEHPRSISGPDFRATIIKADGTEIVVGKIPTMLGGADRLRALAKQKRCELPGAIDLCWDDNSQWSESADGLRLGIRIEPWNREEFHPGELMSVVVKYQFDPTEKSRLLPLAGLPSATRIHLQTLEGKEFIFDPHHDFARRGAEDRVLQANDWTDWQGSPTARTTFRLSNSKEQWVDANTKRPAELSLGHPESFYRIWAECKVVSGENPPKNAWHGNVRSGQAVMSKVTAAPVGNQIMKLSDSQSELVKKWLARPTTDPSIPTPIDPLDKPIDPLETPICDALALTENEGLALRFVEICKTDPKNAADAFRLLSARAGTMNDGDAGIDGPYLKAMAEYALDVNEGKHEPPGGIPSTKLFGISQIVVYVNEHPEDREIHDRVVDTIKKLCRSIAAQKALLQQQRPSVILYHTAWPALDRLGMLKLGMTKEEAVDLLGKPAQEDANSIQWVALRPGFENPYAGQLTAEMKNGKVSKWQRKPE